MKPAPTPILPRLWLLSALLLSGGLAQAQEEFNPCGPLANTFGPFDYRSHAGSVDYRNDPNNPLRLVDGAHFKPQMEALTGGKITRDAPIGPEFDYVLRAFPNHHRALNAAVRLSDKLKQDPPQGMRYPIECWFERAIRFKSDDVVVRMMYASYLGKLRRADDGRKQLEVAKNLAKDNPVTNYNIGMVYFDLGDYEKAVEQAHLAASLGMARPELRQRLSEAGRWREPAPAAADAPASDAASEARPQ